MEGATATPVLSAAKYRIFLTPIYPAFAALRTGVVGEMRFHQGAAFNQ